MDTPDTPLRDVDWRDLLPRLLLYATWVHRRTLADVPGAPEPGDLVQSAVGKVLEGRRTLPGPDDVATVDALRWAVRSEADNARRKAERRGDTRLTDLPQEPAGDAEATSHQGAVSEMWRRVRSRIQDDDELLAVVSILERDPGRPTGEIAEEAGWPPATVYRIMRRLRYRLAALEVELRQIANG